MGTRADFYVGRGEGAEWLGSIAWDGYPDGIDKDVLSASVEQAYREKVANFLERDDGTIPDLGWPWPWETSHTTDYAYAFDNNKVWVSNFGSAWWLAMDPEPEDTNAMEGPRAVFPKLKDARASAPAGSKRSGVMVISVPKRDAE